MKVVNYTQRFVSESRDVEVGAIYKHYKRSVFHKSNEYLYKVICIANYSEDIEQRFVVYKALYSIPGLSGEFARPYDMFIENVFIDGKVIPRFEKIENAENVSLITGSGECKTLD